MIRRLLHKDLGHSHAVWCLAAAIFLCPFGHASAEPAKLPWGRIAEEANHPGVFRLEAVQAPANNRFELPEKFPTIVRCESISPAQSQSIDFELDANAGRPVLKLFPTDKRPNPTFRVHTAGKVPQLSDGRIVLLAQDAKRASIDELGTTTQLNFAFSEISSKQLFTWTYEATRWGKYTALLTYAAAGTETATVSLLIGDQKVDNRLKRTGSTLRFTTARLGSFYLAKSGPLSPKLALDKTAANGFEIKALILEPACEGKPPVQTGDEPIVLHSRDSTVHGTMLRYEPDPKKNTLGFWVKGTDAATWEFAANRLGDYDVEVLQGCGKGQGGSDVEVLINQQSISFQVEDTGHFQNFKPRVIGRVQLTAKEGNQVRVQPKKIAKYAALDLRQLRLIPVIKPAP